MLQFILLLSLAAIVVAPRWQIRTKISVTKTIYTVCLISTASPAIFIKTFIEFKTMHAWFPGLSSEVFVTSHHTSSMSRILFSRKYLSSTDASSRLCCQDLINRILAIRFLPYSHMHLSVWLFESIPAVWEQQLQRAFQCHQCFLKCSYVQCDETLDLQLPKMASWRYSYRIIASSSTIRVCRQLA